MTVLFATMFKLILMDFVNGFSVVGKAFAVATVIVFGGASLIFGFTASKLEIQNVSIVPLCLDNILQNHESFAQTCQK